MKVVLDTNVIIAAFATQGLCHLVFESVIAHHELILSEGILEEVERNFQAKLKLSAGRIKEISSHLKSHATMGEDKTTSNLQCRDKDDVKILALAVNANAEVIVTGDEDLLILKQISATSILSPREFWTVLKGHRS